MTWAGCPLSLELGFGRGREERKMKGSFDIFVPRSLPSPLSSSAAGDVCTWSGLIPANTGHCTDAVLLLGQRRRRLTNSKTTLGPCIVFAGKPHRARSSWHTRRRRLSKRHDWVPHFPCSPKKSLLFLKIFMQQLTSHLFCYLRLFHRLKKCEHQTFFRC